MPCQGNGIVFELALCGSALFSLSLCVCARTQFSNQEDRRRSVTIPSFLVEGRLTASSGGFVGKFFRRTRKGFTGAFLSPHFSLSLSFFHFFSFLFCLFSILWFLLFHAQQRRTQRFTRTSGESVCTYPFFVHSITCIYCVLSFYRFACFRVVVLR